MSTGGARPHASLMPDTSRTDLDLAWKDREAEAALLATGGFYAMASALRIYALEIRLKELICRHLKLEFLPKVCKTHDLAELVIFNGLWMELNDPVNVDVIANWDILADFSKRRSNNIRYQPSVSLDAVESSKISTALDDPINGVLAWLSRHP